MISTFGTEPIISSPELSSRQHPDPLSNQSNFNSNTINNYSNYRSSTRSGLDPSQRHSIAVSPTPEKQDSATQSTDTINTSSIRASTLGIRSRLIIFITT